MPKNPKVLGLMASLGLALASQACTESFDLNIAWTAGTTPDRALTIDNLEGPVRLVRGPADAPLSGTIHIHAAGFRNRVEAEAGAKEVGIIEQTEGPDLVIATTLPAAHRGKHFTISYDLTVPEGIVVSVLTDKGRVKIEGLTVASIETTFGAIDLLRTAALPGETARIVTNDGPITVDVHGGALDASTTNAGMSLFSVLGDTRATTTQGLIEARLSPPEGGDVFLATTNAPVDLSLSPSFGARLVAATTEPGRVVIDGLDFRPGSSFPGQAEGTLGDGRGRVDVRTTMSDIVISR